jgi:hypothetical protein
MSDTFIAYKAGHELVGKAKGYYIFNDTISDTYGATKDVGQDVIQPPYCGYYLLDTLLTLKGIALGSLRTVDTQ